MVVFCTQGFGERALEKGGASYLNVGIWMARMERGDGFWWGVI